MALTAPPRASPMVPPPPGAPWSATKTDASPVSQGLVFGAFAVAFAALAIRANDPAVFVAPAAALALGIAISIGTDVRRYLRNLPGILVAAVAMVVLTVVWMIVESRNGSFPYAAMPLVGLLVLGMDWAWVERLRPLAVVSGLGVALLFDADLAGALGLTLIWFAITATALWSLQRDTRRALPTPVPIAGGAVHRVDPSGQELALIAGASIALGLVATLLISMIHLELNPPSPPNLDPGRSMPRPGSGTPGSPGGGSGSPRGGSGSANGGSGSAGGGSAGGSTSGSSSGSGSGGALGGGAGGGPGGGAQDQNGDGVIDAGDGIGVLDANGDGIIDDRDSTDPVDQNGDGIIDGGDGYVFLDANDDGVIDERDGVSGADLDGNGVPDRGPQDQNGDGVIDREDVPILSDTNDDGVIDRRDVVIVEDLDGNGSIDAGDVTRGADRNGDGQVDRRDDLEVIDANGDGAVDDGELLDTIDRDGDGTIDRDEALVLDRNGNGRLEPAEIADLPLSGEQGEQLEEQRREMETEDLTRTLLIALGVVLLLAAAIALFVVLRRRVARHQERVTRPWALVLVERLEDEGALRGRSRRGNEPITHYAAALGDGPLPDPRLAEVGLVISSALFGPLPPEEAAGDRAGLVIDEAVAANPLPTRAEQRRTRRERRGEPEAPAPDASVGAAPGD